MHHFVDREQEWHNSFAVGFYDCVIWSERFGSLQQFRDIIYLLPVSCCASTSSSSRLMFLRDSLPISAKRSTIRYPLHIHNIHNIHTATQTSKHVSHDFGTLLRGAWAPTLRVCLGTVPLFCPHTWFTEPPDFSRDSVRNSSIECFIKSLESVCNISNMRLSEF